MAEVQEFTATAETPLGDTASECVWSDDEIRPGSGFPLHAHANMEVITYVREGAITHKDSLGNDGRTEAGDVQVMSAGEGFVTPSTTWGALRIRADGRVLGGSLRSHEKVQYALGESRFGYLVPATGAVEVNGVRIDARDGAAIAAIDIIEVVAL